MTIHFCKSCNIKLANKNTICPLCGDINYNKRDNLDYPIYKENKNEKYYFKKFSYHFFILILLLSVFLNLATRHIHPIPWSITIGLGSSYLYRIIVLSIFELSHKRLGKFLWTNFFYLISLVFVNSFIFNSFKIVINTLFPIMILSIFILVFFLVIGKEDDIYKDIFYVISTLLGNIIYFFFFAYFNFNIIIFQILLSLSLSLIIFMFFFSKSQNIKAHFKRRFYK